MIQELQPMANGRIVSTERIQKFICVHHNGESFVTWQKDSDAARNDCREKSQYGDPWKVLAYPEWL